MTTVHDIYQKLCEFAPLELQMDFDNSGFLIGRSDQPVEKALLALDITDWVIDEAIRWGAQLIISHHPILFSPLQAVTDQAGLEGKKALRLAENHVAAICMHTNLDIAQGGVNDVLIDLLGAQSLIPLDSDGCGRIGILPEAMGMGEFLELVKERLGVPGLRYVDSGKPIKRLAVMGGSGGSSLHRAFQAGCDCYVTADVKYHQFLEAKELGISLIDADHFCTENPVIPDLCNRLAHCFPDLQLQVSEAHGPVISFF